MDLPKYALGVVRVLDIAEEEHSTENNKVHGHHINSVVSVHWIAHWGGYAFRELLSAIGAAAAACVRARVPAGASAAALVVATPTPAASADSPSPCARVRGSARPGQTPRDRDRD
eukprot:scpid29824/ scgid17796/ 